MFPAMEAPLRRCGRCQAYKPVTEFAWRRRARNQRHNMCRPCHSAYHREHYLANKDRYVDQARMSKRRLRLERTKYLFEYFASIRAPTAGRRTRWSSSLTTSTLKESRSTSARRSRIATGTASSRRSRSARWSARTATAVERHDGPGASARLSLIGQRPARAGDRARTGDATLEGSSVTTTPRPRGAEPF